jgi:alkanesulfonate monooxygenase SsuD/methylene tetrahydromethanopterin reductase-like flavin-dependent oxidoreductase (luciferase family)
VVVGSGFVAYDYDRFGVALETGRERMREGLEVILKAWKGGPFTHEGKYYRHHNLEIWPRPQQRPHPPIWISCSQTPESFEWSGRNGYSVLTVAYRGVDILVKNNQIYRDAWKAAGHPPGQGRIAAHYQVVLSEDGKEARAIIAKALERYLGATTHTLDRSREDRERSSQTDYRDVNRQILDIDQMLAQCRIVAGTPDDAVRILEKAHDMMGFTQVDCTFYFGGIPFEQAQRSQRLFATQVMPRLRGRVSKVAA